MYYTGTEQDCKAYDAEVSKKERYQKGDNWATPVKHQKQDLWAVLAHKNYASNLETVDNLEGWLPLNTET